jgi:ankyrin repeat protein
MRIATLSQTHELLSSASLGEVARVQQLLDSGVPLDAASPGGFTAFHAACMAGQAEVQELLQQHHQQQRQQHPSSSSASLEPHLPRCVAAAASLGYADIICLILTVFDLRQVNLQQLKPLCDAAAAGPGNAVQLLLQQCAMAVDEAAEGTTALHHAAWKGLSQVVQLLLQAGADVHAKTGNEETPLHLAAMEGHADVPYKRLPFQRYDCIGMLHHTKLCIQLAKITAGYDYEWSGLKDRRPLQHCPCRWDDCTAAALP